MMHFYECTDTRGIQYMYVGNMYYICIHDNIDVHVGIADSSSLASLFPQCRYSAECRSKNKRQHQLCRNVGALDMQAQMLETNVTLLMYLVCRM